MPFLSRDLALSIPALRRLLLLAVLGVAVASLGARPGSTQSLELDLLVEGLAFPTVITHAGDDSRRLFVAEQTGAVRVVAAGAILATPFLTLDPSTQVLCCGERGLLGLAFHPSYASNGRFFVHYTSLSGDTRVSEFLRHPSDPNRADPASERVVLEVMQPVARSNHKGGSLEFGPDGYLYLALGDGGSQNDPDRLARNLQSLLGKILRIDVDGALPYEIPASNPFVNDAGARDEIYAYGLRNPWRVSFDRLTGDLFIGDVGQFDWEEISVLPASSVGGENFGWDSCEALHPHTDPNDPPVSPSTCTDQTFTTPILEYGHSAGRCSVTGGYRYRQIGPLANRYLYGDYCTGEIWLATETTPGTWSSEVGRDTSLAISTFGEDQGGAVYVAHRHSANGAVYRVLGIGEIFSDGFESGGAVAWTSATN